MEIFKRFLDRVINLIPDSGSKALWSLIPIFWALSPYTMLRPWLFVSASFLSVFVLTVDRFLAIHLHLRYQELVTHKRVVAVVVSTWVFRASITFLRQFYSTTGSLPAIIVVVCIITTGLLYCKIYAAVRHHTNQIHVLQVQQVAQNGEMPNAARQRKMVVATFYVYVVYLVCYLPVACIVFAKTNGETVLLSPVREYASFGRSENNGLRHQP